MEAKVVGVVDEIADQVAGQYFERESFSVHAGPVCVIRRVRRELFDQICEGVLRRLRPKIDGCDIARPRFDENIILDAGHHTLMVLKAYPSHVKVVII